MFRHSLAIAAVCVLSACGGGGGKSALIDACVEEGESKKDCTCMAETMEEGLSPKAFEAMVLGATGKEEEAEALMEEMGMSEAMSVAGVMLNVVAKCGVSGFGD